MTDHQDAYYTVNSTYQAEFKDRGSKFIAFLFSMTTSDEFSQKLIEIKGLHQKARHHCFAYRILLDNAFRYNDDGEPSGTAGKPIFNQLISNDLMNVGCIVVRYFGGTKLGTSGLINAYKEATKLAISQADVQLKYQEDLFIIQFDYAIMGKLMDVLKSHDCQITEKRFIDAPEVIISVAASELQQLVISIKAAFLHRSVDDITDETEVQDLNFIFGDKADNKSVDF